ncbi:MAG: glycosyltransferase [Melioribacteraceae bacterium]|nr:glycosyltransferase [Melioribacteraceae bacterium]MCF8352921.1 glycosyltransferase [Melioribacteraceae bacterium]MCF8395262.1 glycosyltransferase [Melioribacteraceae bacterium]MCF8417438.1 glycosyltransferase [Melioribacteraceae bacterium]
MKFSIIIPTLNEIKLLPNLLDQLNDVTLRKNYDYEIIISDGGSTDGTREYALNHSDKFIEHTENRNQNIGEGRNLGADMAEGDILIFLNGDILISSPEKFFELISNSFADSNYSAMTCCVSIFPEESKLVDKIFLSFYNNYFHVLNIIGVGMGRGECHIIKRKVFDENNGYNNNLAAGEDFDLFKRIRRNGKILFSREIVIYESPRRYRKHGHVKIFFTWLLNSIFVMLKHKSLSKTWEEIR